MSLPQQTKAQKVGFKGEAIVEHALLDFCTVNKLTPDFGFDFLCHLLDGDSVTPQAFFTQVKTDSGTKKKPSKRQFSTRTLTLWYSSPIPVYLLLVFLNPKTSIYWINVHELLSQNEVFPESLGSQDKIALSLNYNLLTPDSKHLFVENIKRFHKFVEENYASISSLKLLGQDKVDLTPHEYTYLEQYLETYYTASSPYSRAILLETMIDTWEKLSSRSNMDEYPVRQVRVGLRTYNEVGLRASIRALLYMESDIITWLHGDLEMCGNNMSSTEKTNALIRALKSMHNTPYAESVHFDYRIIGNKVANIARCLFEPELTVERLLIIRDELREWKQQQSFREKLIILQDGGSYRDSEAAVVKALDDLRFFKDPTLSQRAWYYWEQKAIESYSWDESAHIISIHSLHEYEDISRRRKFSELSPKAQELVLKGLKKHRDPAVRLDCAILYSENLVSHVKEIITYIDQLLSKNPDESEVERLNVIRNDCERYLESV